MGEPPTDSVFLVTGDPDRQPASFARFALPFVSSLERLRTRSPEAPVYRRDTLLHSEERRRYFTPETADALYGNTLWLKLTLPASEAVVHVGERAVRVNLLPPRIVLFEGASGKSDPILSTGFLLVDIAFPEDERVSLDEFLVINELFRYWREPWPGHEEAVRTIPDGRPVSYRSFIGQDQGYTSRWAELLRVPVELPNGELRQLITDPQFEQARNWISTATGDAGWIAQTDERAFVWTCVLTPDGSDGDVESTNWTRILNVDLPSAAQPTAFELAWVRPRTYHRWQHLGTLYGFNVHSGAMLGRPCEEPPTWRHFRELYFDQVLLLLYLRVSTLRFSRDLSEVSEHLKKTSDHKKGFAEFRRLRRSFAFLTNVYRFPLLSSQQQGIEMYACARRHLDVDELFDHVQKEIESTHEFFEVATAARTADTTRNLTWIAALAGILAVVFTALAVDWPRIVKWLETLPLFEPVAYLFAIVGLPLLIAVVLLWYFERRNR